MKTSITEKDLQIQLNILNKLTGQNLERYTNGKINIGHYYLDKMQTGYKLEQIVGETGTCKEVSERLSKKEMYIYLTGMNDAFEIIKYGA